MTVAMKKQFEVRSLIMRDVESSNTNSHIKKQKVTTTKKAIPISFTTSAKQQLALLLHGKDYLGIRIKVLSGGCLGSKYAIEYVKTQDKFDEVVCLEHENQTIKIFIDPKALFKIFGITVDYVVDKLKSGFNFINPKEKGRCGCGKSFH